MTFPPLIPRPERADNTVLPALLAVLLLVLIAVQLMLPPARPDAMDLPPGSGTRAVVRPVGDTSLDPILTRRSIFQPSRRSSSPAGAGTGAAVAAPLDGAAPAGIVRVRGVPRLILQTADGRTVSLRRGQSYRGWRLISLASDSARFSRDGETVTLGLGSSGNSSYSGFGPQPFTAQGYDSGYSANQADER